MMTCVMEGTAYPEGMMLEGLGNQTFGSAHPGVTQRHDSVVEYFQKMPATISST